MDKKNADGKKDSELKGTPNRGPDPYRALTCVITSERKEPKPAFVWNGISTQIYQSFKTKRLGFAVKVSTFIKIKAVLFCVQKQNK